MAPDGTRADGAEDGFSRALRDARDLIGARVDAAVYVVDHDMVLRHADGPAMAGAGISPERVVGAPLAAVLTPEALEAVGPHYAAALGGRRTTFTYASERLNRAYWVQVQPIATRGGRIEGALAIARELSPAGGDVPETLPVLFSELHEAVQVSPSPAMIRSLAGECLLANDPCAELLGRDVERLAGLGIDELVIAEDREREHANVLRLLTEAPRQPQSELRFARPDGSTVPAVVNSTLLHDPDGRPHCLYTQMLDISARRRDEERLQRRLRQQSAVADLGTRAMGADVGLQELINDAAAVIASSLEGHTGAVVELVGDRFLVRADTSGRTLGRTFPLEGSLLGDVLAAGTPLVIDDVRTGAREAPPALAAMNTRSGACVRIGRPETPWGGIAAFATEPSAFSGDDILFLQAIANVLAEAARREHLVADALHRAMHDPVTGLPNRSLLEDRLRQSLAAARRAAERVAVLFVDLDDFKVVNDSLGHHAGDAVLRAVAGRLRGGVRASDTVARFGGDEFVIVAGGLSAEEDALVIAEQVLAALRAPVTVDHTQLFIGASIGIGISGADAEPDGLIRDADTAMYRAKDRGRGRYELLDESMRERAVARLRIEQDLRRGMAAGELLAAFQPIIRLDGSGTYGAEVLLRWQHPTDGMVGPAGFLGIAEHSGLIVEIGEALLMEACARAARWNVGRSDPLCVKVNVSPRQLADPGIVEAVAGALASSGLPPRFLGLEITEQALMGDEAHATATLADLKKLGIVLLLDDFGTGYSSLSHLKRFPIDAVKIDRGFIEGLDQRDGEDEAIVNAVIGMGRATGKMVVAEGIETPQQCLRVRDLGCHLGQGYHFGRPVPAAEFERWLAAAAG